MHLYARMRARTRVRPCALLPPQIKPLPRPDEEIKKRRGGKRLRKMKERYGLTDVGAPPPLLGSFWG